jgi:hypothetical protein
MARSHWIVVWFLWILSPAICFCQDEPISDQTKVTSEQTQRWLRSGDPRLIAWAAYFGEKICDDAALASMSELAERWMPPEISQESDPSLRLQIDAMADVLDALIVCKRVVSPAAPAAVSFSFPVQSAILASRLPLSESTPLLLSWYGNRSTERPDTLARIAAMMLSKMPPPGFASSIVAESEMRLEIDVVSVGGVGSASGGGTCGDAVGAPATPDWPSVISYTIEENNPHTTGSLLIEAGGDRITYTRNPPGGWGSCFIPAPLAADKRWRLVAEMLGGGESALAPTIDESASIVWKDREEFLRDISNQVNREEERFRTIVHELLAKEFLTVSEASALRPKIIVKVVDQRSSTSEPLPALKLADPNTVIEY